MADRDLEVSGFLQSITGGAQEEKVRRQRRAEQTERLQQIASGSQTPLSSTLAATLGDALGKGMLRAFGVEDPDIEQARRLDQLQEYMSSLDLTTEQGNMQIADVYRQMGDYDKATQYINVAKGIASDRAALAEVKEPTENQIKRIASYIRSKFIAEGSEINEEVIEDMARNIAFDTEQEKAAARVAGITGLKEQDYVTKAVNKFTSPQRPDGSTNPFQIYNFDRDDKGRFTKLSEFMPGANNPMYNEQVARQELVDEDVRRQQMMERDMRDLNMEMQPAVQPTDRPQTMEQVVERQRREGSRVMQPAAEATRSFFGSIVSGIPKIPGMLERFILDPEGKRESQRPR